MTHGIELHINIAQQLGRSFVAPTFLALEVRTGFVFPGIFLQAAVRECLESIKCDTGV